MNINTNTNIAYRTSRWMADAFKNPFYQWRSHGSWMSFIFAILFKAPIMIAGLAVSLPLRKLSIWTSPSEGYVKTTTQAPPKEVADRVSVLSYNILGMPSYHAAKEKRTDIDHRFEDVMRVIRDADADVVILQEVHAGSALEKRIIRELQDKYSTIYHDMGPKAFFLGSGLMVLSKFANTDFEFRPFTEAREIPTKKGFGVLTIKDRDNHPVVRIADTHFQSGRTDRCREIRRAQAQQIVDFAGEDSSIPLVIGGDLNFDRSSDEYNAEHPFSHEQDNIRDGFANADERARPTSADFQDDPQNPSFQALDNIIAINMPDQWELTIEQCSPFENRDASPSDHAAMLAEIQIR